ncbi:protein phosphatase 2C domain-containing protein [Christensenellaceae bacterium OttesenSCG-928-M15]|nr:protein phosphatase 2C domain-containing protein [Christensenellaceae bacterium OttesenSCG-928-M15]
MLTYASMSEVGSRAVNEDSVGICPVGNGFMFTLADGLGGHGQGEVASSLAAGAVMETVKNSNGKQEEILEHCILHAQQALLNEQNRQGLHDDIKTTITLLYIQDDIAQWAHVGDSRVYLFKKDKLFVRTLDHSVTQMLVAQGEIRERDIRFHEDRNRLIRVLGMAVDRPKFDLSGQVMLAAPMSFLLCSDGFWELIDEKEMTKLLRRAHSPEEWLNSMRDVILYNGQGRNMDNFSAIAVFVR